MTLHAVRDVSRRSGHRARRVCALQPDIESLGMCMTLLVIRDGNRRPDIVPYGYCAVQFGFFVVLFQCRIQLRNPAYEKHKISVLAGLKTVRGS